MNSQVSGQCLYTISFRV